MNPPAESEREKYEKMWARPEYRERSPGFRLAQEAYDWMKPGGSICDFGAGTGKATQWFADKGLVSTAFDIAENAVTDFSGPLVIGNLWDMPDFGKFDYGYCCDVMEHIPTEFVGLALKGIANRVEKSCFFQIALFECHMGALIGEPLHLTVKPPKWWREALARHFPKIEIRPHPKYVIALCHKSL